jgi:cell division protein FtsB
MREFQERRRIKKLLHSRYAIAFLVIVLLFVLKGVWGVYVKYEKSKDIALRVKTEAEGLQAREASLNSSIAALGTAEGKEKEIRDRFGVVKPGEKMVVLVDNTATTGPIEAVPDTSWWARITSLFGF